MDDAIRIVPEEPMSAHGPYDVRPRPFAFVGASSEARSRLLSGVEAELEALGLRR